jgi:perosamine synthetase
MGHPVDLDPIYELARRFGLVVIEDAAEAVGADYKARPVGRTDSIAVYSFNGNKIITTGGGGMILTDRTPWADRAKYLTTQAKDDPIEYVHGTIGFNYRLTNLQAALGLAQLESLEEFVAYKRSIAWRYRNALAGIPGLSEMPEAPWARSTYWLYTLLIDPEVFGMDSRELANHLQSQGIQTRPLWQPIHLSKPHHDREFVGGAVAERLCRQSISLPCSVGLDLCRVDEIAEIVRTLARGGISR